MTTLVFDVSAFRVQFPAFSNVTHFPDALLQGYWEIASCYISTNDYGWLRGHCRQYALNLMVAHIAQIGVMLASGTNPAVITSATVGEVTIGIEPPPIKNQFTYWLSSTPYGMQLLALLNVKGVGGISVGGLPEKSAFRRVGGVFM
jgi:hypothetical protein